MAIPPLVSSTPPPLDSYRESDDDEFGDFTTGGIDALSLASDSPHKAFSPVQTPTPTHSISPRVNGLTKEPSLNSAEFLDINDSINISDDILTLEKSNDLVNHIITNKQTKSVSDSGANENKSDFNQMNSAQFEFESKLYSKENSERNKINNLHFIKSEVELAEKINNNDVISSNSSNLDDSIKTTSVIGDYVSNLGVSNDPEPLSLILDDPENVQDAQQNLEDDDDFYSYENFKGSVEFNNTETCSAENNSLNNKISDNIGKCNQLNTDCQKIDNVDLKDPFQININENKFDANIDHLPSISKDLGIGEANFDEIRSQCKMSTNFDNFSLSFEDELNHDFTNIKDNNNLSCDLDKDQNKSTEFICDVSGSIIEQNMKTEINFVQSDIFVNSTEFKLENNKKTADLESNVPSEINNCDQLKLQNSADLKNNCKNEGETLPDEESKISNFLNQQEHQLDSPVTNTLTNLQFKNEITEELNTNQTLANLSLDDDFADFSDFTCSAVEKSSNANFSENSSILKNQTNNVDENDDFGDFGDFESSAPEIEKSLINKEEILDHINYENVVNKVDQIIKTMFNFNTEVPEVSLISLIEQNDSIWSNLKNVEETNALSFQWPNSNSNTALLNSLGIDSRNILFGPRWNPSIPRFAANLGYSPLEPMKADDQQSNTGSSQTKVQNPSVIEQEVPAAQFDWNSSGLVNPLDENISEANSQEYRQSHSKHNKSYNQGSAQKSQKHSQSSRNIEPIPGTSVTSKKNTEHDAKSRVKTHSSKKSTGKDHLNNSENVVMDRYGRPMAVKTETMKVLQQLPDISFLSARTLLYNPEQKQIVTDLGAMINRKMPG